MRALSRRAHAQGMPDVSEFAPASSAAAMEVLVLFADDLPPLADGPRWAQHALRIAADYPGHILRCSPRCGCRPPQP